jgi:hypothetical protein
VSSVPVVANSSHRFCTCCDEHCKWTDACCNLQYSNLTRNRLWCRRTSRMPWRLFEVEQHANSYVAFPAKSNRSFLMAGLCNLATAYIVTCKPSKAQWSLYVPPGLTFNNSAFCSHCVFRCSVWISEQTAIISLYIINWLLFITETVCLLRGTGWIFNSSNFRHWRFNSKTQRCWLL